MTKLFLSSAPARVYPRPSSLIRLAVCALIVGGLAACGGGGGDSKQPEERVVRAPTFAFRAPFDWVVQRRGKEVSVTPEAGAPELVAVTVFRTLFEYTPSKFARAVPELDRTAREFAGRLESGKLESSATVTVAGIRSRQYELSFKQDGEEVRGLITFVLRDRTEYQLFCRWKSSDDEPDACRRLTETFTPI